MPVPAHVYRPRNPKQTPYYRCVEDHLETLEQVQREQMVRYYGFYSNVSRGLRQKENDDALIPCVLEPDENTKPNRN